MTLEQIRIHLAAVDSREPRMVFDEVNEICAAELEANAVAVCERCHGRGIVGHMGIGHDQCPACRGVGVKKNHDVNLPMVVLCLRDKLVSAYEDRVPVDALRTAVAECERLEAANARIQALLAESDAESQQRYTVARAARWLVSRGYTDADKKRLEAAILDADAVPRG